MSEFEVREFMAGGRRLVGWGRRCGRPEQEVQVEARAMYRMRLRSVTVQRGRAKEVGSGEGGRNCIQGKEREISTVYPTRDEENGV